MYLVTDRANIAIVAEYPYTVDGWERAITCAATLAQMPELYSSGITLEKRLPDGSIQEVITLAKSDAFVSK